MRWFRLALWKNGAEIGVRVGNILSIDTDAGDSILFLRSGAKPEQLNIVLPEVMKTGANGLLASTVA